MYFALSLPYLVQLSVVHPVWLFLVMLGLVPSATLT